MNALNNSIENTRIIRDAIEAASFRRHECSVEQIGNRLCVSVSGIADDTLTHSTTLKELWRLCALLGLNYDDHKGAYQHGGTFASTGVDGLTLADVVTRMAVEESEDE